MDEIKIKNILQEVASGKVNLDNALGQINDLKGFAELNCAKIDTTRKERCGFPEFIYGEGKTLEQLTEIIKYIKNKKENVLATRIPLEIGNQLTEIFKTGEYDSLGKTFSIIDKEQLKKSNILIATAGTTDLSVALEAEKTIHACGYNVKMLADTGVAGIHRLLSHSADLEKASVIITVAGMEGALPSVIGGLVSCPVIAVPSSVGYGASLGGLTAMFSMLNSCASGITVVNIDNGFGAGCAAVRILHSKK